ncbi:MAG: hypothetical protein ACT4P7_03070 [Gemmatimonadaceae bacterium]
MYSAILITHNLVRWVVVLAGLWAFWHAWRGWMQRAQWTDADLKAGKAFAATISLQFVLGVLLYAVSPLTRQGMADMGAAMSDPAMRKIVVEHPVMMLISVALTHIGLSRVRKAKSDSGRFQTATIWWGIALASILGFIPWDRPLLPF